MGIYSANNIIREARLKAGFTQEQMSEGICTAKALSRIENKMTNVSHATFQALMERAGVSYNLLPVFDSREGFDCFYALKKVHLHLNSWQLKPAYQELLKLSDRNWAGNKLYFQEWLLLHCRLQFCSYCCSHQENFRTLLSALHITRPNINLCDFRNLLLSQNEIRILTALSQEALYLGQTETCLQIHEQVTEYLTDSKWPLLEKERLQAEDSVVYTKYLIAAGDYCAALETAESSRHEMAYNMETAPLLELTFLTGICCFHIGKQEDCQRHIKSAFYSAYALESCYATVCRNYIAGKIDCTGDLNCRPDIPLKQYPSAHTTDCRFLKEGLYDAATAGSYTLGNLIQNLRQEQNLSQASLCQGLCTCSKLSKIENNSLLPDIMLAEALLQRLGLSDRVFTFWGNKKEKRYHDLKFKIMYARSLSQETINAYLKEMEPLPGKKEILYQQEWLYLKTMRADSLNNRIAGLKKALQLTLPQFNLNDICSYRLTWCELTILNNIAHEYRLTNQAYLCSSYTSQIMAYLHMAKPDILLQKNILPHTYLIHCRVLYLQKFYEQVLAFTETINNSILKYNISAYSGYLFFYSQALGEYKDFEHADANAINSCAMDELIEYFNNSAALKTYFSKDFAHTLPY